MKISVIIPNYNDIRIKRALESVYKQTYNNYEIIVVDGLSTNEMLLSFYKSSNIDILIMEKDHGIFDGLNKGIKSATGDMVFLMGSDDCLSDNSVFEKVYNNYRKDSTVDGICIGCKFVDKNNKLIRLWNPKSVTSKKILSGIYPPHFSLFLKRELYSLVGLFKYKETENIATDTIWLLDLALVKPQLHIPILSDTSLVMEYGGASTGSVRRILQQFIVVHNYAKRNKIPFWFFHSFIKSTSKLIQFINK
jgi:glycosyltransferase